MYWHDNKLRKLHNEITAAQESWEETINRISETKMKSMLEIAKITSESARKKQKET